MSLSPYLMNVALHALLLSAAVSLALVFLRKPSRRAALALAGILGVGVLPWVPELPPRAEVAAASEPSVRAVSEFPAWRVVTIPAGDFTVSQAPASGAEPAMALPSAWTLAAWAWLAGSAVSLLMITSSLARLARWRASLRKPDADEAAVLEAALPGGLALRVVRLAKAGCSPCVTGFFRPVLVLPGNLLESCSGRELAWIIRHESMHYMGRDSRWTLLIALVRAVFWWNPFVHHLAKNWAAAREEVCDLHAEASERASYGNFLIRMAAACPSSWMLASPMVGGAKRRLKKRLVSFLNAPDLVDLRAGRCFVVATAIALPLLGLCSSCVRIGEREEQVSPAAPSLASALDDNKPQEKGPHVQVKLSTKVLGMPTPPDVKNGQVLSPDELQKLMVKTATMRGAMLLNFPAITMRNSESGLIEMIREKPPTAGQERVTAGWELLQRPHYDGKSLRLSSRIRYAYVPKKQFSLTSQKGYNEESELSNADWKKLVVKTGSAEAKVPERHALITALGEVAPGMHAILITEVAPIDATGRPVDRYRDAVFTTQPLELNPGKVRLKATLLSGDQMAEMDKGLEHDPNGLAAHIVGIFNRDQWQIVKKGLTTTNLADARLPTEKAMCPWMELPELQLEAHRYKGESVVSLDFSVIESGNSRSGRAARQALSLEPGTTIICRIPMVDGKPIRHLAITLEGVD